MEESSLAYHVKKPEAVKLPLALEFSNFALKL